MEENYLESMKKQFAYYKQLGERTFDQLSEKDLFWQPLQDKNSIGIIVNHLSGNMKSRWTDFLTADGEKTWRQRDEEFMDKLGNKAALIQAWESGWKCLFQALDQINPDNFNTIVYIRNQGHTVVEAINRQLAHYAYHVGQIVFIGILVKGDEFQSLSIPKGKSGQYNQDKFSQDKRRSHFTDEYLRDDDTSTE